MVIAIIGGGASGMAAALAAAENPGCRVVLLERQARLGRKLQATGNGRCNLTNLELSEKNYHGARPNFARPALTAFGPEETLAFFRGLGLLTAAEAGGRVYPLSDQAGSVVDVLRFAAEGAGVETRADFDVTAIRRNGDGFSVCSDSGSVPADRVVLCCGGMAGGNS